MVAPDVLENLLRLGIDVAFADDIALTVEGHSAGGIDHIAQFHPGGNIEFFGPGPTRIDAFLLHVLLDQPAFPFWDTL
jgi:hypothetical protein